MATKRKKLWEVMSDQMRAEGWETIRRFTEGSKVPFSLETTRRVFSERDYETVAPHTVAIVSRYLGFTPDEIRDILKKYTHDKDLWPMIGEGTNRLDPDEQAVVDAYRAIVTRSPGVKDTLAAQLEIVGQIAGVDVSKTVDRLKRKG